MDLSPNEFGLQKTTIWSFPDRGRWATHSGSYRGNWSPYIPRNLILLYSQPGECILDQFLGSGTTLIEAKLLGRNAVGTDINPKSILISEANINFECEENSKIYIKCCDARNLNFIKDESIDLICTHPPYADIIKYSENIEQDLSLLQYPKFLVEMEKVAKECYRVIKNRKICAIMMGDIRRHKNVVPLGFKVMDCFLKAGFNSKEIIIKEQHNCKSTPYWSKNFNDFLLLAHEYIFVFEK